jgi:DNA invertase Pin-like site-specific DNA recombinase
VVQNIEGLQRRQIGLRSLHEQIDTTGPDDPAQLRVFAAVVACDRTLLSERTQTGLSFATRGRSGGSKRRVTPAMVQRAAQLMQNPDVSVQQICQQLSISRATLYRYVSPTGAVRKE